jgi:serine/threonine-protein kinase
MGVGAITLVATGAVLFMRDAEAPGTRHPADPGTTASGTARQGPTVTHSAEPLATAPHVESPLAALAGHWKSSNNREYSAVMSGDELQFRIVKATQHPRQGYEDGDVRFALRAAGGSPSQFAVVDDLRPTPPPGVEYDPARSRDSCIGTWSEIKGQRLTARYDGKGALTLQLALIRTGAEKFKIQGKSVIGCVAVASAPAQVIESQLTRTP